MEEANRLLLSGAFSEYGVVTRATNARVRNEDLG